MRRIAAACVVALGLAGCTALRALPAGPLGQPQPLGLAQVMARPTGPAPDPRALTCEMELSTGSHISHRVCRSAEDRDLERAKAEYLLHRGLQQGTIVIH
jgi:hypothetical protein